MDTTTATAPAPDTKKDSFVDTAFDAATKQAARGLAATQRALEAGARWLEGRAKAVGVLADKLTAPKPL